MLSLFVGEMRRPRFASAVLTMSSLSLLSACSTLLELDNYHAAAADSDAAVAPECRSHRDCNGAGEPAICHAERGQCVQLASPDCQVITGDYQADDAIVIGTLFGFGGSQSSTSLARQHSAQLAIEQINGQGGVPRGMTSADARPLVLVGCDSSKDLHRAGAHLIDTLGVPAIIGPSASQEVLDLSRELSVPHGTVVISPTAQASSIADLLDDDLTWQMVPTDLQRGPLLVLQIEAMEAERKRDHALEQVKLLVVFRNDALGAGTRESLNALQLNDRPLSDPENLGSHVFIYAYDVDAPQHGLDIPASAAFAPDIVVLAGTAEMVTEVMLPLERAWPSGKPRPDYIGIEGLKVAELLEAAKQDEGLRRRIRGTGAVPSHASKDVYDTFQLSYQLHYPEVAAQVSGIGPTYDATYAVALALAATYDRPVSGRSVAAGLDQLWGGAFELELRETQVLAAFSHLVAGSPVSVTGTFGPLAWGANGAILGGNLELWCIGKGEERLRFESSPMALDLLTGILRGDYVQCP